VVLSEQGADYFTNIVSVPIFMDDSFGRSAWFEMSQTAQKHDTFVYTPDGELAQYWDIASHDFFDWTTDIRAAVNAVK
jgi:hypothetical protein